jgi:hypothetical protein
MRLDTIHSHRIRFEERFLSLALILDLLLLIYYILLDSYLKFDVSPLSSDSDNVSISTPNLSILPSYILANTQKFFDQLWNLLSSGGDISPQIWDLISMIPTNSELASRLTSISK